MDLVMAPEWTDWNAQWAPNHPVEELWARRLIGRILRFHYLDGEGETERWRWSDDEREIVAYRRELIFRTTIRS